jgi:hypothetical protein
VRVYVAARFAAAAETFDGDDRQRGRLVELAEETKRLSEVEPGGVALHGLCRWCGLDEVQRFASEGLRPREVATTASEPGAALQCLAERGRPRAGLRAAQRHGLGEQWLCWPI